MLYSQQLSITKNIRPGSQNHIPRTSDIPRKSDNIKIQLHMQNFTSFSNTPLFTGQVVLNQIYQGVMTQTRTVLPLKCLHVRRQKTDPVLPQSLFHQSITYFVELMPVKGSIICSHASENKIFPLFEFVNILFAKVV